MTEIEMMKLAAMIALATDAARSARRAQPTSTHAVREAVWDAIALSQAHSTDAYEFACKEQASVRELRRKDEAKSKSWMNRKRIV